MVELDHVVEEVLKVINDNGFSQKGAFNLRQNGTSICHGDSEHIKIKKKTDKPGIDIYIDGETKGEKVYIPVVVSVSGMTDLDVLTVPVADGSSVLTQVESAFLGKSIVIDDFQYFFYYMIQLYHYALTPAFPAHV